MTFNWIHYKMLNRIIGSSDLEKNGIRTIQQCISHYNRYGKREGRPGNILDVYPDFNWVKYNDTNKLNRTKTECEYHYMRYKIEQKSKNIEHDIILEPNTITFITPTIGRPSLINTIKSVICQTHSNWKYIVVFDGIDIAQEFGELIASDSRISSIIVPKTGRKNYAGIVRNYGIELATTEWIGFVDDDDMISPLYVERMNDNIKQYPNVRCIIYRFINSKKEIIPPIKHRTFYKCNVGISFCYKKELYNWGIKFRPSPIEDYILLNEIRLNKYQIILSNYINYFVRIKHELSSDYMNTIQCIEKNITFSIIVKKCTMSWGM